MSQKTALVTGGNAGIGLATARQLLERGLNVVITSRSQERATAAAQELARHTAPGSLVYGVALDLSHLNTVGPALALAITLAGDIDVLVCNAGVKIVRPFQTTEQNVEWHYQINHLGHYLLAKELAGLQNGFHLTTEASIVARTGDPTLWASVPTDASASARYAASKLANLTMAYAVANKLPAWSGAITANSAHPGFTKAEPYGTAVTRFGENLLAQDTTAGAKPIVAAAVRESSAFYTGPARFELWGKPAQAKVTPKVTLELARLLVETSENQLKAAGF